MCLALKYTLNNKVRLTTGVYRISLKQCRSLHSIEAIFVHQFTKHKSLQNCDGYFKEYILIFKFVLLTPDSEQVYRMYKIVSDMLEYRDM